jgi:hypothetical protein
MNNPDDIIFVASVMRPKASPFRLIRIGGNSDGAYLVPDDLQGIFCCFSPGVSDRKSFEDELTRKYGMTCHLCDASTSPERFKTALMEPGQTFRKAWLHHEPGAADSVTLEEWVEDLSDGTASDLLLQMDIEGAEYQCLNVTPDAILSRFRILVIEFHNLTQLASQNANGRSHEIVSTFRRLDKFFVCVHAHPNNYDHNHQRVGIPCGSGSLPDTIELTFLRRDRLEQTERSPNPRILLPHPLDITNAGHRKPVHLDSSWLSGSRPLRSRLKIIYDHVRWHLRRTREWD